MALQYTPEGSKSVFNSVMGALGLFDDTNKADNVGNDNQNPQPIDEYESKMSDDDILRLVKQWKQDYAKYYDAIKKGQDLSFDYWVGKHRNSDAYSSKDKDMGVTDNLIFEAIETFLPIATKSNPEPLVTADPSDIGQQLASDIKVALAHEADVQQLRRKLAKVTRSWLLNRIGVVKVSWNPVTLRIQTDVINPKKMGFDPEGYIDERGYFRGVYIYERKKLPADDLIILFPKHKKLITEKAQGKMGTKLEYYEWWYCDTDLFYTLDDTVLGKFKNPNWNYDGEIETVDPDTQTPIMTEVQGVNHLEAPSAPYRFLAIFSTQEQPHDNTSLILQNIPQQDKINRRERQIERNVEGMNNGMVVSGSAFTEEQAAQAASALRKGVAIRVPNGDVGKAVLFPERPPLPKDVFGSLQDARAELRNIFGTAGSTAQGVEQQDTVRGKLLVNQMDSSRIGGGITEYIEQLADSLYNLWVQFMFVFYDQEHFVTSAGSQGGMDLITLKNDKFPLLKGLTVTVKEGSLVPKDPLTQRNEAIDLWSANAIDPFTFYKRLDWPDPAEATKQLMLWQMFQKGQVPPQAYLPSFAMAGQTPGQTQVPMGPQPGTGGPAVSPPPNSPPPQGPTPQPPTSPAATDIQSKQLMQSQPLPK